MVTINGKQQDAAGKTLPELLESEGYDPVRVAVELNYDIVPKAKYAETTLNDGDIVEIVSFVGGG